MPEQRRTPPIRRLDAVLLGLGAAYVVSQVHVARVLGPVAGQALRLQTTTSSSVFAGILDGWSERELARYRSHLPPDMIHPAIYVAALTAGAARLHQLSPLPTAIRRALLTAPAVSAACDYAENLAHWHLLDHRERITPGTIRATGAVSNLKWTLALGSLAYLAQGFIRAWAGRGSGRR